MEKTPFLIWSKQYIEGRCVIQAPEGIEKSYQLSRGISRSAGWPQDVVCRMNGDYPKDIELSDNLYGTNLVVISGRTKDILTAEGASEVEYLPIKIVNHKKKIASTDYYILNPPSTVDCIDLQSSEVTWNAIKKDMISTCRQLAVDRERVPESVQIFRPKHVPYLVLVRSALAKRLVDAGLSGLHFRDPLKFTGA